jgi:hypothetical protein
MNIGKFWKMTTKSKAIVRTAIYFKSVRIKENIHDDKA